MATIIFAAPPAGSDSARQRIHTLDPFEAVATVRQRIAGDRRPDVSVPVCLILWPQDKSPTEDLSDGFFQQIKPMSARLGCNPVDALKVWFNESIGIDATQQKAGHYGINQLRNLTGAGFTGTASEYMALGAEGQLPYVEKYYLPYKGRLTSAARLYQVNFLPATFNTVTTPDGILAQKDGIYGWAYDGNPSLDLEKKGYIVLDDLRKVVESAITNQRKWKDGSSSLAARWKEILERLAAAPAP